MVPTASCAEGHSISSGAWFCGSVKPVLYAIAEISSTAHKFPTYDMIMHTLSASGLNSTLAASIFRLTGKSVLPRSQKGELWSIERGKVYEFFMNNALPLLQSDGMYADIGNYFIGQTLTTV